MELRLSMVVRPGHFAGALAITAGLLGAGACGTRDSAGGRIGTGGGGASSGTSDGGSNGSGGSGNAGNDGAGASVGSDDTGDTSGGAGASDRVNTDGGDSGSSGGNGSSSSGSANGGGSGTGGPGGRGDGGIGTCAGDTTLPPEPMIPPPCASLQASQVVAAGGVPSESTLDTPRIQSALNACPSGRAVQLTTSGANNAFATGPLTIPSGVTLWVDKGTTLYGTRNPSVYGTATALITAKGANQAVVGDGVIDGQGGEPLIGKGGSFWDQNGGGGSSPTLVRVAGASNFTMYRITLHNAPMMHVKLGAAGFVVWGITIKTPSKAANSAGKVLTPTSAHNTDGIDPGQAASYGYIVCSKISDGDDQIAIKGGSGVKNLTIAHNHLMAGHGLSIGSETNGGVSGINVYDLTIDGTGSGLAGGSSNGIRIKSDPSVGGLVTNVTYADVCVREVANPIIVESQYGSAAGSSIPQYTGITIRNFHALSSASVIPTVTVHGADPSHAAGVTLDNVIIDGSMNPPVATYANLALGPGYVNFTPAGTGVTVANNIAGKSAPNPCDGRWIAF
jgi:hypothetical protein